jgi:chromate transporter
MTELLILFYTFFKIGLFTIGGGYAMVPLISSQVISKGWMTQAELIDFIGIAESTPGPFAINVSTFVGISRAGVLGAIITTFGAVLPSFIIIIIIAKYFGDFRENKYVKAAFSGLRPVIVGLILSAAYSLAYPTFFGNYINYKGIIIFIVVLLISRIAKLHPIFLILISAVLGLALYSF